MSAATRRELKEIEASLEAAETEYQSVSDRLRLVQQGLLMAMNAALPRLKLSGRDRQRVRQLGAAGCWRGALVGIAGAEQIALTAGWSHR